MPDEPSKFLIVEDSPTMRQMYRLVLGREEGVQLIFAEDGVEGLDRAAEDPDLDLLIVDINMPRMDGLEFLRRLRSELGLTRVPAIVISTESDATDREAASRAGATAFLPKPWTPDELVQLVRATRTPAGG